MNTDGTARTTVGGAGVASEQALGVVVDDRCVYWTAGPHVYAAPK